MNIQKSAMFETFFKVEVKTWCTSPSGWNYDNAVAYTFGRFY